jgi:hypothetical protein
MATPALQDRRLWMGGGALVAIVLAAAAWLAFIHPELSSADSLRSQKSDVDWQNVQTSAKNAGLARQNRNIDALRSKLLAALDALPPDSGLPAFTRQLNAYGSLASVSLTNITVGNIASAAGSAAPTSPSPAGTTDTEGTTDTSATPGQTPGVTSAAGSQYSITVTVQSQGSLLHQLAFLKEIEAGPRRAIVNSTQLTSGGGTRAASVDDSATMSTQLTIFSAPMSEAQLTQLKQILKSGS